MTSQHQVLPFDAADTAPLAVLHAASFAKSWDAAAEAIIQEAVRREYDKLK